jgi:hypothetical protein
MNLIKFLSLLNKGIWLQRLNLLGDPREGELTESEMRELRERDASRADGIRGFYNSVRWHSFVSCWYAGLPESMAMWDLYGGEGAVAVRSTIGHLKQALITEFRKVYIGRVQYLDWTKDARSPSSNILSFFVRKAAAYKHESEVRLVVWDPTLEWQNVESRLQRSDDLRNATDAMAEAIKTRDISRAFPVEDLKRICGNSLDLWDERSRRQKMPAGFHLGTKFDDVADEVVIGPKVPVWVAGLIRELMGKYGSQRPVKGSELL